MVIWLTVVDVYNKSKLLEEQDFVLNKTEIRKTNHQPKYLHKWDTFKYCENYVTVIDDELKATRNKIKFHKGSCLEEYYILAPYFN